MESKAATLFSDSDVLYTFNEECLPRVVFRHALRRISTGCITIGHNFSDLNFASKIQGRTLLFTS